MKKYIIILIVVLFMTGCKATANIHIDNDKITENVVINELDSTTFNQSKNWDGLPLPLYYDQELEDPMWMPNRQKEKGVPYYDVKFNEQNRTIAATASFDLKKHSRSSLVKKCFKYYNVINEDGITIFSTSNGLICNFNNFDIVVSTPYTVLNNNANSVDKLNNKFTWNVRENNSEDVSIYLEIDFSKKYNEVASSKKEEVKKDTTKKSKIHFSQTFYLYIILGIFLAILILLIVLYVKYKKSSNL